MPSGPSSPLVRGVLPLLLTTLIWGGMFPIAASMLHVMDAFHLTLLRYGSAAAVFGFLLWRLEGRAALRFDGHLASAWALGTLGFAGFNLLVFNGLHLTRPEHGAVIMALMPMLTVLLNWLLRGQRPGTLALATGVLALCGILLVASKGSMAVLLDGSFIGDLMILAGALCWVGYSMGAAAFPGWSSLRYTTLTVLPGAVSIALLTQVALGTGHASVPEARALAGVAWQIVYMVALASVFAVVAWNAGMKTLGAGNGVLFINIVPVTAITIGLLRGEAMAPAEIVGATLVVLALLANNLLPRLRPVRPAPRADVARAVAVAACGLPARPCR